MIISAPFAHTAILQPALHSGILYRCILLLEKKSLLIIFEAQRIEEKNAMTINLNHFFYHIG